MKILVDYLGCIFEMVLGMYFFSSFKEKRINIVKTIIVNLVIATLCASLFIFTQNRLIIFIIQIIGLYLSSFCYKFKPESSIYITIIYSALSALSKLIILQANLIIITDDLQVINKSPFACLCGTFATKALMYIIIMIVRKCNKKSFLNINVFYFIGLLSLPVSTMILSIAYYYILFNYHVASVWKTSGIVALSLLVLSNIMIFYVVDRQNELIKTKDKLKSMRFLLEKQKLYYDDVFKSQQEIRKERHNLKNFYIALLGELNSDNVEECKRIITSKLKETENYIDISNETDNMIEAIVYSKVKLANSKGIKINIKNNVNKKLFIDKLDLSVLISNILDNAIESTQKVSDNKVIDFSLITSNDNLVILTENPTINKFEISSLKTTKKDKRNHGYGILSIKSIVEKYKGDFLFECENGVVKTTSILRNVQI